jgi:ATP-dependent Clp protease adaptor protein ClpS
MSDRPLNAPVETTTRTAAPTRTPNLDKLDELPPFRVLLHNDDLIDIIYVVESLLDLTPLDAHDATRVMIEAHSTGVALVLVTHRERAELYLEQFGSKGLTVTIEPAV